MSTPKYKMWDLIRAAETVYLMLMYKNMFAFYLVPFYKSQSKAQDSNILLKHSSNDKFLIHISNYNTANIYKAVASICTTHIKICITYIQMCKTRVFEHDMKFHMGANSTEKGIMV